MVIGFSLNHSFQASKSLYGIIEVDGVNKKYVPLLSLSSLTTLQALSFVGMPFNFSVKNVLQIDFNGLYPACTEPLTPTSNVFLVLTHFS